MKAMIKFLVVAFLLTGIIPLHAQTAEMYQRKIDNFKPMKTIGITLMGAAVPVGILGFILTSDSGRRADESDDLGSFLDSMTEYTVGYIFTVAGGAFLIAGATLTTISSVMIKKYRTKLNRLEVGTYISPQHAGVTLTYRF